MNTRLPLAILMAIVVTFGLLFVMQKLIAIGRTPLGDENAAHFVDFVRVKREETLQRKKNKPKKPEQPEAPPPEMAQPKMQNTTPSSMDVGIAPMSMSSDLSLKSGFGISASDGEYLPLVKVAPVYPRRAASRGIEGYVLVEFTVTKTGAVINPRVVEADPPDIFNKAALRAAVKFKYKPRVVDGVPIEVHGVLNRITFQLED